MWSRAKTYHLTGQRPERDRKATGPGLGLEARTSARESDSLDYLPVTALIGSDTFQASLLLEAADGLLNSRQALEDGVLVDVSALATEAGFKWPFAMTAEVWAMIETIPETHSHEDPTGRLWDVLMVAFANIRTRKKDVSLLEYTVILHHADGDRVRLKLVSGPGDQGEPVLTLMLPWQD